MAERHKNVTVTSSFQPILRQRYSSNLVTLSLFMLAFNICLANVSATPPYYAYCSAYCDIYDNLIPGSYCESPTTEIYCCGTTYNKTCCTDKTQAINTPDETVCGHSWYYYQWSLIYGLVAVLMVILMVVICCICCRGFQIVSRRNESSSGSRQERAEHGEADPPALGFDPTCEYAFEPPRYETLPKDPPKYSELFSNTTVAPNGDYENAAFTADEPAVLPSSYEELELTPGTSANDSSTHTSNASAEAEAEAEAGPQTEVAITVEDETRVEIGTTSSSSSSSSSL